MAMAAMVIATAMADSEVMSLRMLMPSNFGSCIKAFRPAMAAE